MYNENYRQDNFLGNGKRHISCLKAQGAAEIEPIVERDFNLYENEDFPKRIGYTVKSEVGGTLTVENRLFKNGSEQGMLETLQLESGAEAFVALPDLSDSYGAFFVRAVVYSDGEELVSQDIPFSHVRRGEGSFKRSGVSVHLMLRSGTKDPSDCLKLIKGSGLCRYRDDLLWHMLETEKGVVEFPEDLEQNINNFVESGLEFDALLLYGNPLYTGGDFGSSPVTEEALAEYVRFCKETVSHYKGKIKRYEVWNEYNLGWGVGNTPERYAWMLKAVYTAIKEIDPEITVTAAVTCSEHSEWIRRMLKAGAYDYFDALSVHPYCGVPDWTYPDENQGQAEANVQSFKDVIAEFGEVKPVWISEIGWTTTAFSALDRNEQAACYTRLIALTEASDVIDGLTFYDLRDDGNDAFEMEHHWGIIESFASVIPNAPKESYTAISALNYMIGEAELAGKAVTDKIKTISYNKNGTPVNVLWSLDGAKTVKLEINGKAEMYDMYGNAVELSVENGCADLEINENPIYINGAEVRVLKAEKPQEIMYSQRYTLSAVPELREDGWYIKALVKNHAKRLTGRIRLEMPEIGICSDYNRFDIADGEEFSFSAKVEREIATEKMYRAIIDINLTDGTREIKPELVSFLSVPKGKPEKMLISLDAADNYFRIGGSESRPELKADIALSYDEERFYIRAEVHDKTHLQLGTVADNWTDIWDGDGLEFIIQPIYDGNKEKMRFNDFGIALTSTTNEPVAWRWRTVSNRSTTRFRQCELKAERGDGVTYYNASIRWEDLLPPNVEYSDCDSFGFAVRVNYAESNKLSIDGYMQLYGGVGGWRAPYSYQPSEFGRFVLE